uniref:BZIP domain-containing protein n=1 Tax=Cucumis sativus TaxID=3659 RepID=A0A0A0KEX6_CUCSA
MVLSLILLPIWSCLIRFFRHHFPTNSIRNRKILPTICNVEEDVQTQFHSQSQQNEPQNHHPFMLPNISTPNLCSQGSLSIPFPLCFKSIDDVWSEIGHNDQQNPLPQASIDVHQNPCQSRHASEEMTSEGLLVKDGVVQEASSSSSDSMEQQLCSVNNNRSMVDLREIGLSLSYEQNNDAAGVINMSENCFSNDQMSTQSVGEPCDDISNEKCEALMTGWVEPNNKKRIIDGSTEVVLQRIQRRMMKNRKSAALSGARKQIMQRKQSETRQKPTEKLRATRRIESLG